MPDEKPDIEGMNATDAADHFRDKCGIEPDNSWSDNRVWVSIPVLEFLWGRPWNNVALNYVMALRPSVIRVTAGCVTSDARVWRVTVYLEEDERTIKSISQHVGAWGIGCRYGADLKLHYSAFRNKPVLDEVDFPTPAHGIVNLKAVKLLRQKSE